MSGNAFDLTSMASILPPIPIPTPNQLQVNFLCMVCFQRQHAGSIRSKLLCDIPGCTKCIGVDEKHCDEHNPQGSQPNVKNCVII